MTPKCIVENYFVKEIACGQHHFLFTTVDGKIFGMGSNKFGQLGILDKQFCSVPYPISIDDCIPMQIFSGWNFSGCLTNTGNVYLWGRCDMGQLAFDPQSDNVSLKKVKICKSPFLNISLKSISKVATGSEFCLAIDHESNCLSWGWNEHGNCGCGHNLDVLYPTHIGSAVFIAAGYGFGFLK